MVSGSKNKEPKKKQPLVLAKNKNQAILAIAVIGLFLANSVYMVAKYFMEQNPGPASTATTQAQAVDPAHPEGQPGDPMAKPTDPAAKTPTGTPVQPTAPMAPPSGLNPIIPILILLLIAGGIYGVVKYLPSITGGGQDNQAGNNSRVKQGSKGSQKLVFAKDKKQASIAITVIGLFLLNTVYMIGKYIYEQNPPAQSNSKAVNSMAQEQQQNLQNMDDPRNPANSAALQADGSSTDPNNIAANANDIYNQTVNLQGGKPANRTTGEGDVEIMSKTSTQKHGKMTLISVADSGRSNPFLPAVENLLPSSLPQLSLLAPPETAAGSSDASKVMSTTISGILYDKYSPSAIINIEGTDYLVKKGDVINNYRILSVGKTQVLVQLGKNVYKAGVGELLTLSDINFNTIANLNKKFGGNDVSINVKKKGY